MSEYANKFNSLEKLDELNSVIQNVSAGIENMGN